VAKHDRAAKEKRAGNALYALRYRQRRCKSCGHRSRRGGPCALCDGTSRLSWRIRA